MLGAAMACLLALSPGNSNVIEAGSGALLVPDPAVFTSSAGGVTARLQVAALETAVPDLWMRETALADEAPEAATTVREEPQTKGWLGAGILGVALSVGVGAGLIAGTSSHNTATGYEVGVASGLVAGVGGYYLGTLANEGSLPARISVVVLDAVAGVLIGYGVSRT
jgi:hypothetical protein